MPRSAAPTEKRLIVIILRGGLDSLHALAPYADSEYSRVRPTLALGGPSEEGGVIDLNGYFGLHPALAGLNDLFLKKRSSFAAGIIYEIQKSFSF